MLDLLAVGGDDPHRVAREWQDELRELSQPPAEIFVQLAAHVPATLWITTARDTMLIDVLTETKRPAPDRRVFKLYGMDKPFALEDGRSYCIQLFGACDQRPSVAATEQDEFNWLTDSGWRDFCDKIRHHFPQGQLLFLGGGHHPRFVADFIRAYRGSPWDPSLAWVHSSALPAESVEIRTIERFGGARLFGGSSPEEFVSELVARVPRSTSRSYRGAS